MTVKQGIGREQVWDQELELFPEWIDAHIHKTDNKNAHLKNRLPKRETLWY